MKYPKIPKAFLKTDVELTITSDKTGTNGKAGVVLHGKFKCNYQSVNTKNSTEVERSKGISSVILIDGNIFKSDKNEGAGGVASIYGIKHNIVEISLVRNPDGTVNYTRITTK